MTRELNIVIPAFNEEKNIEQTITGLLDRGDRFKIHVEIVVVDDGSTDSTYEIVTGMMESNPAIHLTGHNKNRGFGEAVRTGIKHCKLDKILLVPADGQFDPDEIDLFEEALDKYDLVIGCRSVRSGYSLFRQFVSLVYINMVNLLFAQNYPDTNWVQAWRREIFERITPESKGVFFLQETITRARMTGFKTGYINSNHLPRTNGTAHGGKLSVVLYTLYEMFVFWWKKIIIPSLS